MIDAAALGKALARGETLPADWYVDPAVLRLEQARIFARSWQYAGHADLVAESGDYFSASAGSIPIVVVRTPEGGLNAFVNVCRHRGHIVADGSGNRATLQCRYHAWTYDLDGSLRAAPRSEREPGFDFASYSLLPVSVDTWGPLVFVNPDSNAAPLAEALGPLPGHVAASGLDLDRLRFREHVEWTMEANWKVAIENYLECYHCPVAHPGFSKVYDVDPDAYLLRSEGLVASQFAEPRAGNGAAAVTTAQYHLLWPNTTFNIDVGPGNMSVDVTRPAGPERSAAASDYFYYEDVSEEEARELREFGLQVGQEDNELVESVQRGLASGMVPHGRLLTTSEHLIQHFQRLVAEALA